MFFQSRRGVVLAGVLLFLIACGFYSRALLQPSTRPADAAELDLESFLQREAARSGYNLLPLVREPLIRQELALTGGQNEQFQQLANALLDDVQANSQAVRALAALPENQRNAQWAVLEEQRKTRWQELEKQVSLHLTPPQLQRLGQITLQLRGPDIFADPEIKRHMSYTDDQMGQLAAVRANFLTKARGLRETFAAKRMTKAALLDETDALRAATIRENLALLTPTQRSRLEALRGEDVPFQLSRLALELRRSSP